MWNTRENKKDSYCESESGRMESGQRRPAREQEKIPTREREKIPTMLTHYGHRDIIVGLSRYYALYDFSIRKECL